MTRSPQSVSPALLPCAFCGGPASTSTLETYDAGLLNDYGGGNVEWWQDYIRAELGRAHDFYADQILALPAPPIQEGWRPIETAPRDFTPIIGWREGGVRQWYRWVDDRHLGTGWYNSEQGRVTDIPPTHWQPLPAPPTIIMGGGGSSQSQPGSDGERAAAGQRGASVDGGS